MEKEKGIIGSLGGVEMEVEIEVGYVNVSGNKRDRNEVIAKENVYVIPIVYSVIRTCCYLFYCWFHILIP